MAHLAPLSMEFSRQEYWSGLPFSSPGNLPNLGVEPGSPSEPPGKPIVVAVKFLSHVQLFAILWTTAHQASLSFTISQSLLKLMSIELVMPSTHLIFCHQLILLPSFFHSFRIFSNELALHIQ